jgi:hypothetical protein
MMEARARLTTALDTFTSIDARLEIGRTRLDLARLAHRARDHDVAVAHVREARATLTALELPAWIDRASALEQELTRTWR